MSHDNEKHHISSYKQSAIILGILLLFTFITVASAKMDLGNLTVAVALIIASIKGTIVALYFMHLKFDNKILGYFTVIALAVFTVILLFAFLDYGYRV